MRQEMTGFLDGRGISWTACKQSAPRSRQTTTPASQNSIFTGWMLFLTPRPNRLYQSTDKKGKGNRGETELVVQNYSVTISAAEIDPPSTFPVPADGVARKYPGKK